MPSRYLDESFTKYYSVNLWACELCDICLCIYKYRNKSVMAYSHWNSTNEVGSISLKLDKVSWILIWNFHCIINFIQR